MFSDTYAYFKKELEKNFPSFKVYTKYNRHKHLPDPPCFIIECISIDRHEPIETGEIDITTRWQIRHIIPRLDEKEELERGIDSGIIARDISARIAAIFDNKSPAAKWGVIRYVSSIDENWEAKDIKKEIWTSDFEVEFRSGVDAWTDPENYKALIGEYPYFKSGAIGEKIIVNGEDFSDVFR